MVWFKSLVLGIALVSIICCIMFLICLAFEGMIWLEQHNISALFGILAVDITIFTFLIRGIFWNDEA